MTTAAQINALLDQSTKLADAATPGPWEVQFPHLHDGGRIFAHESRYVGFIGNTDAGMEQNNADARYVAATRTALPARDRALLKDRDFIAQVRKIFEGLHAWNYIKALDAHEDSILAILKEGK